MRETEAEKPDGRRLRGQENRRRIVEALIDLIGKGDVAPTAERVAAAANVGLRTVFRHFEDMDSLYREITVHMETVILPVTEAPLRATDWREQLVELVDRRARLFDRILPYRIAGDVHRHESSFLRRNIAHFVGMQRQAIVAVLPANLASDRALVAALDLVMSVDGWRRLRLEQKLSFAEARNAVLYAVRALTGAGRR